MNRFKNILCIVDSELKDNVALEHAVKLAENNQATLTVVEVLEKLSLDLKLIDFIDSSKDIQANIIAMHQERLEKLVAPFNKNIEIQTKVLIGIPFLEIIREVLRNEHDLLIKTAENGELIDRVFGSDDMHLLRKCPCPIWLVKSDSPKRYQRILAAVDVDDFYPPEELNTRYLLNLHILEMASSLALLESADLHVVHVWDAIGESIINLVTHDTPENKVAAYVEKVRQQYEGNLDELMRELTSNIGQDALNFIRPLRHLIKGHPRKEIPLFTEKIEADLVIMGTVARTGISGIFMGNTAESILNQLKCSVLAIKPPGFETPVSLD